MSKTIRINITDDFRKILEQYSNPPIVPVVFKEFVETLDIDLPEIIWPDDEGDE